MDLKRLSVVLLLVSGGLLLYVFFIQSRKQPQQAPPASVAAPAPAPAATKPAATAPASAPAATKPATPAVSVQAALPAAAGASAGDGLVWKGSPPAAAGTYHIGSLDARTGYLLAVEVTSEGAAVNTIKLSRHFATVTDKHLWQKDPDAYEQARRADPETYKGHYSLLNPVTGGGRTYRALATRRIHIRRTQGPDPAGLPWRFGNLANKTWRLEDLTPDSISLSYEFFFGRPAGQEGEKPVLKLTKTYTVRKDDYSIEMSLRIQNLSGGPVWFGLDQGGPSGLLREDIRGDSRLVAYGKLNPDDQQVQMFLKRMDEVTDEEDDKYVMPLGKHLTVGTAVEKTPTLWIAHANKFFASMLYVVPAEAGRLEAPTWDGQFYVAAAQEGPTSRTYLTGVRFGDLHLEAGRFKQIDFAVYAGPKKRAIFTNKDHPQFKPLYKKLNYLGTIEFGRCCTWAPLTLGMMWLLDKLSIAALGNYGVAIILLVVLVRLVLHPLTKRSQMNMMKMQKLAPQMQKLKEKYADDKETLNKEMMRFYKKQGATPLLGCLPMIIQMPIWIALWTSINAAVELRHAGLLPVWITDLAAPDALLTWSTKIPLIGTQFNLLPLLLTVAMFFQTKFNPQMSQAAATPDQQKQQKMMRFMMPAMMLFIFYRAPSGLTLYIMASTAAGVAEQFILRRHMRTRDAAEAAKETTIVIPGKGARSSRPKKPKGPSWVKRG